MEGIGEHKVRITRRRLSHGEPPTTRVRTYATMAQITRRAAARASYIESRAPGGVGYVTGHPGIRRAGAFKVFYHVYSPLLSNSPLQNRWGEYDLHIDPAAGFAQDPMYTVGGAFAASPPYARIADAEQGRDLQTPAHGHGRRSRHDGWTDGPHTGDRVPDPDEAVGPGLGYTWDMDWDPDGENNAPIARLELLAEGVFRSVPNEENALIPQLDQALEFTVPTRRCPATSRDARSPRRSGSASARTGSSSPSPRRRTRPPPRTTTVP